MRKLLIGVAVLFAGSPALAQVPPPPGVSQGTTPATPAPPVRRMEQVRIHIMGDKVMTRDEVAGHVRRMFEMLDRNRDGFVTRDELAAMHESMMAMGMHEGMAGHDRAAAFDRLDTNHDGMISRQEFMAAKPHIEERRVMVMRDGGPAHAGAEGMRFHAARFGGQLFEMADTNHDGRVSLQEATNAALQHFDRADLNHDGKLTPEERRQAYRLMRGSHKPS